MANSTTAERLREIISIRNIKQVDLIEQTGISKGALSSYISGRYVPKQDNIYKLSKALGVNPAWLMGLDVPMETPKQEPDVDLGYDADLIEKAMNLYNIYKNSNQQVRYAVDVLLKSAQLHVEPHDQTKDKE